MVDFGLPREAPMLLHFDGEFATAEDLTVATLTGRNFGWLPAEASVAMAHIARVIREDNGRNSRQLVDRQGKRCSVSRRVVGDGIPNLPPDLVIPERYRIDVMKASDGEVLEAVAKLIHAYMDSLRFGTHNTSRDSDSPYDLFLQKNGLPTGPQRGESNLNYSGPLLASLRQNKSFKWVAPSRDGTFKLHDQPYRFGKTELQGLKIFLTRGKGSEAGHAGNCVMCHSPPHFTDHKLHNTGVSQTEYENSLGPAPSRLLKSQICRSETPTSTITCRLRRTIHMLTAAFALHLTRKNRAMRNPGAWNVFANPDLPKPQKALAEIFCGNRPCDPASTLPLTLAFFKTASVRDLGQSNPYFHSGAAGTIEDALHFYVTASGLARAGKLRNGSPELADIHLTRSDVPPLAAFLRSLNEDYH